MIYKIKQQLCRWRFTSSNRLPKRRARQFILNYLRTVRVHFSSVFVRATIGLVRWGLISTFHAENRIAFRSNCFVTGRMRGSSRRFTVARTRLKQFSGAGRLIGLQKSSW